MSGHKPQHRRTYAPVRFMLRQVREGAGLSQQALASKMHLPQSAIHKSEDGSRRVDFGEFIAWLVACGADPRRAVDEYMQASGTMGTSAGKWPMETRETTDQAAKERKVASLLEEAAALLKKDRRKSPRRK